MLTPVLTYKKPSSPTAYTLPDGEVAILAISVVIAGRLGRTSYDAGLRVDDGLGQVM